MKKILIGFLAGMGVLFCLVLLVLTYFFITDPYNLKPLFFGTGSESPSGTIINDSETGGEGVTIINDSDEEGGDSNTSGGDQSAADEVPTTTQPAASGGFTLSAAQKQALVSVGVDPTAIPSIISQDQEDCFVRALGSERVNEIKTGAVPTPLEFLRAQSCI